MDSVTQFVLGAAVGEVVLGKKAGNRAVIWGGVGGTIPDLDVFLNIPSDEVTQLLVHRGISHSLFFPFIAAPIIAYWVSKWHPQGGNRTEWTRLFFWCIFTHPLLDLFTGYGTGLFTPFYDYRFQLDTIFIIDPGYTLPLLVAVLIVLLLKKNARKRQLANWTGLALAHIYLIFTIYHKLLIQTIVEENIHKEKMEVVQYMTAPTPFNNFLWWALLELDQEYLVAYYSFFDTTKRLQFKAFKKNKDIPYGSTNDQVQSLIKFSKGFYTIEQNDNALIFNDLRFGPIKGWFDTPKDFLFSFDLKQLDGNLYVKRRPNNIEVEQDDFIRIYDRVKGI